MRIPSNTDCVAPLAVVAIISPALLPSDYRQTDSGAAVVATRRIIESVAGWDAPSSIFGYRLGEDPEADHRVADHQDEHSALASQSHVMRAKVSQSRGVGEEDGDDVADDDGGDGEYPDDTAHSRCRC